MITNRINTTNTPNRPAFKAAFFAQGIPKKYQADLGSKFTSIRLSESVEHSDLLDIFGKLMQGKYKFGSIESNMDMKKVRLFPKAKNDKPLSINLAENIVSIASGKNKSPDRLFYFNNDSKQTKKFTWALFPVPSAIDSKHITAMYQAIEKEVRKLVPPSKRNELSKP